MKLIGRFRDPADKESSAESVGLISFLLKLRRTPGSHTKTYYCYKNSNKWEINGQRFQKK